MLDRVLENCYWFKEMEYTHVTAKVEGLLDHTPLKIIFPTSPRCKVQFKFCEMWCIDPQFGEIV